MAFVTKLLIAPFKAVTFPKTVIGRGPISELKFAPLFSTTEATEPKTPSTISTASKTLTDCSPERAYIKMSLT